MNILIACECSGRVREALRAKGHTVISVDLDPAEDESPYHVQGDVLEYLDKHAGSIDMMIGHPPCTYLANSGARWLYNKVQMRHGPDEWDAKAVDVTRWLAMENGAKFFAQLFMQPIPKIAVENPIMHVHARAQIEKLIGQSTNTHFVQPWWFGDPAFKATGFTLKGLPPLVKSADALTPPPIHDKIGRKAWSVIHQMPPSKTRGKDRSRTFPGVARAIAEQWG